MTYYGVSYLPPTSSSATFDSSSFIRANEALTYQTALDNFLAFPTAQGTENLKATNVSGVLTLTNDLIINGPTGASANYIQFTDGSQQSTAFVEADYAQLNTDNLFESPFINTFQGNSNPNGTTAPFRIAGNTGEYISLFIDPGLQLDATLYSAQTTGGLTIRNSGGNSFTMTPTAPNNTAVFSNPISCGSFPLTAGAITGTQLTLSSGANTSVLTTTINGLNIADPIVSTGNITGTGLTVATTGNDTYTIDSRSTQGFGLTVVNSTGNNAKLSLSNGGGGVASITCTGGNALSLGASSLTTTGIITGDTFKINSPGDDLFTIESLGNFGLFIANTTGNNGKLTLSNNGSIYASMTCTAQNEFTFSGSTIVSTSQTYPLPSSNQTATISYVNQAISSQGGGDASLTASQTFSGVNTFSNTVQTSALQTFPQLSTNQFATYAYVNNIGETSGFNFLKLTCPQFTGSATVSYQTQGGPLNDSGQAKFNVNTSVSGSVTTYLETWRYCYVSQSNLSPINNCIFTLSFSTGTTPLTSNENVSIRVVNGGTQYTLPCVLVNNNTQFQTTTPLDIVSGGSYAFYLQGSYI